MKYESLKPKKVFHWFKEISNIPRESGNEKAISDFLVQFAKERNLEVIQDEALNVIIKKPATKGYEKADAVIIQGHMDMVCVKSPESHHNFAEDGIELIIDGEWLRANQTTLGADNGIAVAFGLAILDSKDLAHPAIEVLITTEEETGLSGANGVDGSLLSGRSLINIDTEEEGEFITSCAGGINLFVEFLEKPIPTREWGLEIKVTGCSGGHSGMNINEQRANANKLLGELLHHLWRYQEINIAYIEGGNKHNAIPTDARVGIYVEDVKSAKETLAHLGKDLVDRYALTDPKAQIILQEVAITQGFSTHLSERLIQWLYYIPDGVVNMMPSMPTMVETSTNLGVIVTREDGIECNCALRGSHPFNLDRLLEKMSSLSNAFGGGVWTDSYYPGWEYEEVSKIREKAIEVYERMYQTSPKVLAIHAGLECGILKKKLPDTSMISFGPDIRGAHTFSEKMNIKSVERVWDFTCQLLASMK